MYFKKINVFLVFVFVGSVIFQNTFADGPSNSYGDSSAQFQVMRRGDDRQVSAGHSAENGILTPLTPPAPINGTGRKLLAIYMVGSDLEGNFGAGTSDFGELIAGYQSIRSNTNVDVIVAFGGANKDGWRGMKFANITQIIADSADGEYGNETGANAYLYVAPQAHMGDISSLQLFLEYTRDGFQNYSQRFITLWDHGASYEGFGNDENYNMDSLSLHEIDQAFTNSGIGKLDMIGFDACLMASLEVASAIKNHADYMIASEELEPGHGWEWSAVLRNYANEEVLEIAAIEIVDNFVQNIHEYSADGKTLSVVNLNQYDALSEAVNTLSITLSNALLTMNNTHDSVIKSIGRVRSFGTSQRAGDRTSIDLKHLALLIRKNETDTDVIQQIDNLINTIDSYVIWSAHDGTRPNSYGVAISSPEQDASISERLGFTGFGNFQQTYLDTILNDSVFPSITEINTDANSSDFSFDIDYNFSVTEDPYFQEFLWIEVKRRLNETPSKQSTIERIKEEADSIAEEILGKDFDTNTRPHKPTKDNFIKERKEKHPIARSSRFPTWFKNLQEENPIGQPLPLGKVSGSSSHTDVEQPSFMNGERSAFVKMPSHTNTVSNQVAPAQVADGVKGTAVTIEDENLEYVSTFFGNKFILDAEDDGNLDEWFLTIAGLEAYPTSNEGQYFTPEWNQQWYFMKYSDTKDDVYIPMYFDEAKELAGYPYTVYTAEIDYQDSSLEYTNNDLLSGQFRFDEDGEPVEDAEIEFIVTSNNQIIHHDIRSYRYLDYDIEEDNSILYDKSTRHLKVGDKIRFYSLGINLTREGLDYWFPESDLITIEKEPEYYVDVLQFTDLENNPLDYFYSVVAADAADNITLTELVPAALVDDNPGTNVPNWELY